MSESITAPGNPLIKSLLRLHRGAHRREDGRFLAEGTRIIDGFLAAGLVPEHLLVESGRPVPEHWPRGQLRSISQRVVARLSQASTASGYIAVFPMPQAPALRAAAGGLVLHGIADPGNAGTMVRTAAAFGWRQTLWIDSCDPWSGKAVQASAGALAAVAVHRAADGEGVLADLAAAAPLCALVAREGVAPDALAAHPRWLVVGSEAHGLPAALIARCSERVTLPMASDVESLNAAAAAAIACFTLRW
jgi:TrmH family RNA methyltransferase